MNQDLEIYILEAKDKNKEKKKKSVLEKYKDDIQVMIDSELELKQIHAYLKNKYDVESNYPNFCKWVNRHIKKDKKIIEVESKKFDKEDNSIQPYSAAREAYSKHKPL